MKRLERPDEFRAAMAGELDHQDFRNKYDVHGLERLLHRPSPELRLILITTFVLALPATIYVYAGLL